MMAGIWRLGVDVWGWGYKRILRQYLHFLMKNQQFYLSKKQLLLLGKPSFLQCHMQPEQRSGGIVLGYYPFRAQGQIPRLLCEYLQLPYHDRFFDPDSWQEFKRIQQDNHPIMDLPFLIDGDFFTTGSAAIVTYLICKAKREDLLGRTIVEKMKIDSIRSRCDVRNTLIGAACSNRPSCPIENKKCMQYYWQCKIKPTVMLHQQECQLSPWYFGELTIVDFIIYQMINQLEKAFQKEIPKFTKLNELRNRVLKLPAIHSYQHSQRSVRQFCPVRYFSNFRQQKIQRSLASTSSSTSSRMEKE